VRYNPFWSLPGGVSMDLSKAEQVILARFR